MAKPKGWHPLTDDEQQDIIRRYEAGEHLTALADEYHRSKETLRILIREGGRPVRGRGNPKGIQWTPERREAHRLACSTPEFAAKARAATLARLANARESPAINTAIERRLHDALKAARIGFTTQSMLLSAYLVDIELRQAPVVIEADGVTHTLPLQKAKDAARDVALEAAGYQVFRFTGSEINTDAAICVRRVIEACGLTPDEEPVYDIRTRFAGESHPNWKGGKREYICEQCGETFWAQPKHRRGPHFYCTRKCANTARSGQPLSEEHLANIAAARTRFTASGKQRKRSAPFTAEQRARMSAAQKGKPKSPEHVAKVAEANRGKVRSPETRAKISASLKRYNSQIKI